MGGGGGADIFEFTNGLGGASNVIEGFVPGADTISLNGFSSYSSALVNGSEVITLSDGTHIELSGISSMSGVAITYG
jgi:Ca2+-binding RTX toxin-like protein